MVIGGGALVLFLVAVPLALWWSRRAGSTNAVGKPEANGEGPAVSTFGLLLMAFQVILMLAAAIIANFKSGLLGAGVFLLSFLLPWAVGEFFRRRGYSLYVSQANISLQRDRVR